MAGVRWQDKIAYGFPIIVHPDFGVAPDVRHPYYGPIEASYDGWIGYRRKLKRFNWGVQLNVHNIGVGKGADSSFGEPGRHRRNLAHRAGADVDVAKHVHILICNDRDLRLAATSAATSYCLNAATFFISLYYAGRKSCVRARSRSGDGAHL